MLGELFTRSTQYVATDTVTGISETFVIDGNLSPDWTHGAYEGAMSIPGVWRATLLLSDLIGQLPWHGYRQRAGGPVEMLDPTPPLLDQPAPPDTRMTTFTSMCMDLLHHGNAIALIAARSRDGWPTAILPVSAEFVRIRRATQADGFVGIPEGAVLYEIGRDTYSSDDVIHIKGPTRPGWVRGFGVLENHLQKTLALADEQGRQARQLGTSGVPTGILKSTDPDLDEPQARELHSTWMRSQRDRTVAVLNGTTDFQPLSWNPSETQLLDARKFSLTEIALIFGIDPSWLGQPTGGMTYKNVESEAINLIKFSLSGILARFEQGLSLHLPRGTWAKANLDGLLRPDTLARYEAHAIALQNKFMTADEVREIEDMPPLTAEQKTELAEVVPPPVASAPAAGGGESL